MILVFILEGIGAVLTYFSNNFELFLVTRAIQGGVILSISIIPFVLGKCFIITEIRV